MQPVSVSETSLEHPSGTSIDIVACEAGCDKLPAHVKAASSEIWAQHTQRLHFIPGSYVSMEPGQGDNACRD